MVDRSIYIKDCYGSLENWLFYHFALPFFIPDISHWGFPGGSDSKESACNVGDLGSIPELVRSPGERNGYPIQYSGLENSIDRRVWQATVHGVAKSRIWPCICLKSTLFEINKHFSFLLINSVMEYFSHSFIFIYLFTFIFYIFFHLFLLVGG